MRLIKIDICTTAYNEAENLQLYINNFLATKKHSNFLGQLVIIDNGSVDNTSAVLSDYVNPDVKFISLKDNLLYGGGMKKAIQSATSKYVAIIPADNQYSFEDVANLCKIFLYEYQNDKQIMIKGKRINRKDPLIIRLLSKSNSIIMGLLIGQSISDVNGLPKIFSVNDFLSVLDKLPNNASFDSALLLEAKKLRYIIYEYEIPYLERRYGLPSWHRGRFKIGFRMLISMLKYRFYG